MKCPYCKIELFEEHENFSLNGEKFWEIYICSECGKRFCRTFIMRYEGTTEILENEDEIPVNEEDL